MTNLRRGPVSEHPLYPTWNGIRQRTGNPKTTGYEYWGGRGIALYAPWREDFWAFAEYVSALPNCGEPGRSIDRLDVNGHYEPGNLRWATDFEQMQNTRAQLDPMNGIQRDHGKSTFYYHVTRNGELYAEYGFASPDDAAAARDLALGMMDAGEDAQGYIQRKRDARQDAGRAAREEADKKDAEAKQLQDEAREARKLARELDQQARGDAKTARQADHAGRAARYAEMNKTMTFADIARAGGVSVAHVSMELSRFGYEAVLHNSTGYPGVKQITKGGRTYYVARMQVDGKRKQLGQRKTAEEAYELILEAKGTAQPSKSPQRSEDSPRRTSLEDERDDDAFLGIRRAGPSVGSAPAARRKRTVLFQAE